MTTYKVQILRILLEHKVLNTKQVCRLVNRREKDDYDYCYYSFKEKPKGCTRLHCRWKEHGCTSYSLVRQTLLRIKGINSVKMRFWDKGGIGSDVFRFWFLNPQDFYDRILRQTMLAYLGQDLSALLS